jgi:hypothetical protein
MKQLAKIALAGTLNGIWIYITIEELIMRAL